MATCRQCGRQTGMFASLCDNCINENSAKARAMLEKAFEHPVDPGMPQLAKPPVHPSEEFREISVSTETVCPVPEAMRLGVVVGTCIFGQHVGRDIINALTDITGGRALSAEKLFSDARTMALRDLRADAARLGADAVIAVNIDHRDLTGGGKSMIMVTAVGTAIRASQKP